jgi:hypothetical protein
MLAEGRIFQFSYELELVSEMVHPLNILHEGTECKLTNSSSYIDNERMQIKILNCLSVQSEIQAIFFQMMHRPGGGGLQ